MIISDGSQNHYNFCKYHFPNLFTARHETNLINKMCFFLRIFNYGIICSDNKTILDCRGQNKKCFFSLLSVTAGRADLPASLLQLDWRAQSGPAPDLSPPGLWLVSRPADWPSPPGRDEEETQAGCRQASQGSAEAAQPKHRGRHQVERLAEAGPGVAVNLIKENLKHFRPFTLFYYLMTLIGE